MPSSSTEWLGVALRSFAAGLRGVGQDMATSQATTPSHAILAEHQTQTCLTPTNGPMGAGPMRTSNGLRLGLLRLPLSHN